jgi:cellulose synthase/poly-beta-1,6-N-acetylglucosamine synthase-like glycosyltransferase
VWSEALAIEWGTWIVTVLIAYSAAAFFAHLSLALLASDEVGAQRKRQLLTDPLHLFGSSQAPAISILMPARNDARTIVEAVRALVRLDYPALEVVVVNDASSDGTLDRLIAAFELRPSQRTPIAAVPRGSVRGVYGAPHLPGLTVVDMAKPGSRARAAGFALAYARHPLVLVADAGTVLERETLVRLALPFYEDASVTGVVGVVRPSNGSVIERGQVTFCGRPASRIARFQTVEYLRAMLSQRLAWQSQDAVFLVPGTLGLFSRDALRAVDFFRGGNVGDDVDVCMRLQRHAAKSKRRRVVRCVSAAVAWTRVPESLRVLARQRTRWYQALAEALWFNRELLFNARFKVRQGLAFLFHVVFELYGPVIEAVGQIALVVLLCRNDLDLSLFVVYFSVFIVGGTIPSLMAIALERSACPRFQRGSDLESLAVYALFENLGYRQLTALWRIAGLWRALWGIRTWGGKSRRGRAAPGVEEEAKAAA